MRGSSIYGPNGMFRVAVAVPPLACGIASLIARNKFDDADRQMGVSAIFMGCIGITEGAILNQFMYLICIFKACRNHFSWHMIAGVGILGGIGFTMSILITSHY